MYLDSTVDLDLARVHVLFMTHLHVDLESMIYRTYMLMLSQCVGLTTTSRSSSGAGPSAEGSGASRRQDDATLHVPVVIHLLYLYVPVDLHVEIPIWWCFFHFYLYGLP